MLLSLSYQYRRSDVLDRQTSYIPVPPRLNTSPSEKVELWGVHVFGEDRVTRKKIVSLYHHHLERLLLVLSRTECSPIYRTGSYLKAGRKQNSWGSRFRQRSDEMKLKKSLVLIISTLPAAAWKRHNVWVHVFGEDRMKPSSYMIVIVVVTVFFKDSL
jgi:hypothetical protein